MSGNFIIYAEWMSNVIHPIIDFNFGPIQEKSKECESDCANSLIQAKTPKGKMKQVETTQINQSPRINAVAHSINTKYKNVIDTYDNLI